MFIATPFGWRQLRLCESLQRGKEPSHDRKLPFIKQVLPDKGIGCPIQGPYKPQASQEMRSGSPLAKGH